MAFKKLVLLAFLCLAFQARCQTQNPLGNRDTLVRKIIPRVQFNTRSGPFLIEPIFKTREDSINNALIQLHMSAFRRFLTKEQVDSVNQLMKGLRVNMENFIGSRKVFRGSDGYVPFSDLKSNELESVKRISLYRQKRIPRTVYLCKSLEGIEFADCSIKRLPRKLNRLNVKSIQVYDHQSKRGLKFTKNKTITKMISRGTDPKKIPHHFHKIKNLERLDLSSSGLNTIPASIFKSKTVKECILSLNQIDITHYEFPLKSNIAKLDLSKNKIKVVPSSIGNLKMLKVLQLNHNQIETIEPGIGKLENLVELSFYQNQIRSVPPDFYDLKRLVELDFYHNKLDRLSDDVLNWQDMQILYLSYNNLVSVPANILKLSKLRELYLHNNKLSALPNSEINLPDLKILRLNNNYFLTIPEIIADLKKLENLDLSYNNLQIIPNELWNLKNLKLLSLVSNPWDYKTKALLLEKAELLRKQNVIINLSDLENEN